MNIRRGITTEEYNKLAPKRQNVLDTDKLNKKRILLSNRSFVLYEIEDKFKLFQYDTYSVKQHLLILPLEDSVINFSTLDGSELLDLQDIIKNVENMHPNDKIAFMFKNKLGRSIGKLHMHCIMF